MHGFSVFFEVQQQWHFVSERCKEVLTLILLWFKNNLVPNSNKMFEPENFKN